MFRPHGTRYAPHKSDQSSMSAEMLKRASTSAFSPMISKSQWQGLVERVLLGLGWEEPEEILTSAHDVAGA